MHYKGFCKMKRVAAVILSAAIILADIPGVYAAEYTQTSETEQQDYMSEAEGTQEITETDISENETDEVMQTETESIMSETDMAETENSETEAIETEGIITETEGIETEITETETAEAQITETQSIETEITEAETTETESIETETAVEIQTSEEESIPVPTVDSSVYPPTEFDYSGLKNNAAAISDYNIKSEFEPDEQGKYVIANRDQLTAFLTSTTDYTNKTVSLSCDVDMKGEAVQLSKAFEGTFEGNGHSIYNYKAEGALFLEIGSSGTVRNLHLSSVTFSQEKSSAALAVTNNGLISDITVSADINVTKNMVNGAAGIVLVNNATISNSVFSGKITASADTDDAGKSIGAIAASNKGKIENCHTIGSIDTNAAEIGGIAAHNYGTVKSCTNNMSITGAYYIGGITAENTRTVIDCANYGEIIQKNSSTDGSAGGIAGTSTDTIKNCENYAKITGAYKNIGGIAGSSAGTIEACGNYAEVIGSENTGAVTGLSNGANATVKNSFNKGKVSALSNGSSNNQGIGGILGAAAKNSETVIENCYNTAGVQGAADTKYIGGIAGILYKGSIKNTYNAGAVSAAAITDDFKPYAAMIAGFMGAAEEAVISGSLFLEGSGDIVCYRESGAVTAEGEKVTQSQLKSAESLLVLGEGFASDSNGINDGYPVISGQKLKTEACVIMFEPNGGCADYYFSIVESGNPVVQPASPTKKNAEFKGWFSDKSQSTEYSFPTGVTKSAVLYAGWETKLTVDDMTLSQTAVTLVKGESFELKSKVAFEPAGAENTALKFSSADTSVATVDENGIVKAIDAGKTKISIALADGSLDKTLTFEVSVTDKENIVRFKLYDEESTDETEKAVISVNDPVTVQAVFGSPAPTGATVQWSSSRPDYVKVTERTDLVGINAAKLDGLKPTAQLDENCVDVMCTLIYPDKKTTFTGTLKVTVRPLAQKISVFAGKDDATDKTIVYDIGTKKFIAIGDTKLSEATDTLTASILPKDANQKVKWSSSNSSVISFDDDETGKADSRAIGEATVTATAADGSKGTDGKVVAGKTTVTTRRIIQELSFTPKPSDGDGNISVDDNGRIEIAEGASVKLVPTYVPADATIRKVKWTNANKNALELTKVEEGTNVLTVTAKKVAQDTVVRLTAEATDMGGASCEIEFIIKPKVEKIKIFRTDDTDKTNNLSGKNIGIDPEKDELSFSLMAVNEPDNSAQMVAWKINNTKIADFKDNEDGTCTVKVKGMGTAIITATATDGSKTSATTMLNVTSLASNVEIEGSNMVMKGKTIKLKAVVYPKSANSTKVKWLSLAPEYATVNENTGEVKGVKAGFVLISATASDGSGASGTHAIWVRDPVDSFDIMIPDGDNDTKNDELITGKTIGLDPDENKNTYTVAARILPDTACQDVEWSSSNEKVATVEDGVITAKSLGKTTITAAAVDGSGRKASVTVNIATLVKSISIKGGHYLGTDKELELTAEVGDKDATNKELIWKSSVPKVATVEDGIVTAVGKDGETVITAEAADGSGIKAEHKIYVVGKQNDVTISAYENCEIQIKNKKKYIDNIDLADQKAYTMRLKAELSNGSAIRDGVPMDIKWTSSDEKVATVEEAEYNSGIGIVRIHKAGSVKIKAMSTDGYESSDYVTIKAVNTNPYVEITGAGHRLACGKKMNLSAGTTPVDWYSDNEAIAKVNSKGQVTAGRNAYGTVTITAQAIEGNHFDTYTINVADPVSRVDVTVNGYTVTNEKLGADLMKGYNGSPVKLGALLDGEAGDAAWKISNNSVASIDEDGYVDFKKNGTVTFTAVSSDGSNKKGKVTFTVSKQVTGIEPDDGVNNIEIGLKKSVQLKLNYKPLSSTMKKAVWKSDDPSIVSVNKNSGKITGKSEGTTVITATAADNGGISCSFVVTVNPAVGKVEPVKAATVSGEPDSSYQDVIGIDLSSGTYTVALKAKLYIKSGKEYIAMEGQRVSWKSSNEKIATVDENGIVTGIKSGEATITATALDGSKKSGKVKIYVGKLIKSITPSDKIKDGISLNLRTKKTMELADEFTIAPITATNQRLTFTSSDKKIVTVNANGRVTAKKQGDAVITVTPSDGSGVILEIPVSVTR